RRAGVSSFGMGGTNVHCILEEAPDPGPPAPARPWQLLLFSARTETALETATDRLADHLETQPEQSLADIAFTLQAGRRAFQHRRALVCRTREEAVAGLAGRDPRRLLSAVQAPGERPLVWMLSGLGEHYPRMGEGLYREEPTFRDALDRCAELLRPLLGQDLRELLYPGGVRAEDEGGSGGGMDLRRLLGRASDPAGSAGHLRETRIAQPAVFAVGYALSRLLLEWGLSPRALVGYSLGEYTAACLAGVFSLEDAVRVVAERARLIQELPAGAMLAIPFSEEQTLPLLGTGLSLAAVNGPAYSIVAGPVEEVSALEGRLQGMGLTSRRLETTHAFHSRMMEPVASRLAALLAGIALRPPEIPLISNVTGTWMTAAEATDPGYWTRHLCQAVRFGAGLEELWREPGRLLLEVGPGQALTTLATQHPASAAAAEAGAPVIRTMRHPHERRPDSSALLEAVGRLWLSGVPVDWQGFHAHESRRRVELPTYPFERQTFYIAARTAPWTGAPAAGGPPPRSEPEAAAALAAMPAAGLNLHPRPALRHAFVEPRTGTEQEIAAIWQRILGIRDIGAHDSFFELGGNSLVVPQLLIAVRERFGVDLPVAALFDVPTVAELAGAVETVQREGADALAVDRKPVDLRAEVVLTSEISGAGLPMADWQRPRGLVLTGATGFLGAYLLRDLLELTEARVFCPARAASDGEAEQRIRRNLESRGLWRDEYTARIVPLAADLGLPQWGLAAADFDRLAAETDAIYHAGAWVNFTYPYQVLKPINVDGTVEALRLASRQRLKAVHFISSVAAISQRVFAGGGAALEDAELEHTDGLFGGYGETKWVGEQIVRLAAARGIPVTVHRPGVVSGDTRTGSGNTRDMIWNMMKGSIQLGLAPGTDFPIDVTPVDFVSRAIVHLSLRRESLSHAFHFPNPSPMRWTEALHILQRYGYEIEAVPYARWLAKVAEVVPADPGHALFPFLPILVPADLMGQPERILEALPAATDATPGPLSEPRYDMANTRAGLEGSGIACSPVDENLLRTYLDAFVGMGWLPAPSR
ncbi:MAG TPA: thioester reductase domain-containing protein, partial [Thermoanaerobaculia bacterium]|nr:thioester reductase domain-containing protein [Thermoanaerobaculia bacterium]